MTVFVGGNEEKRTGAEPSPIGETVTSPRGAPAAATRSPLARKRGVGAPFVAPSAAFERRAWAPDDGCRTIAVVDVKPVSRGDTEPVALDVLWGLAVHRMQRCIRPGDRMCMLGGPRLAVCFGHGADRIPPITLGRRLLRAMGDRLSVGNASLDLEVAVGIGTGTSDADAADLTTAAIASIKSGRNLLARPVRATSAPHRPFITVAHVKGGRRRSFPHRVFVPLPEEPDIRIGDVTARTGRATADPQHSFSSRTAHAVLTSVFRVLVVDPMPSVSGTSCLAVEAVAGATRGLGMRTTISRASDPATVVLDHYVAEPHAVVMALQPDKPRRLASPDEPWSWERAARLARALCDTGTTVLAVSVGSSAATVAACVEQGAIGLLDVEALPNELAELAESGQLRSVSMLGDGLGADRAPSCLESGPRRFPSPYDTLVHLTPSERRILFFMMEGCSAADMAKELFVSLTTVRAHIRSILRKLHVNSQLAAVALANGALAVESPDIP